MYCLLFVGASHFFNNVAQYNEQIIQLVTEQATGKSEVLLSEKMRSSNRAVSRITMCFAARLHKCITP
ncbi:MAG: hypothetical protein ACRCVP_12660 [Shewanella xiamenensis]